MNELIQLEASLGQAVSASVRRARRAAATGCAALVLLASSWQMTERAFGQFPGGTVQQHLNQARHQAQSHNIRQQGRWHGEQANHARRLRHSPLHGSDYQRPWTHTWRETWQLPYGGTWDTRAYPARPSSGKPSRALPREYGREGSRNEGRYFSSASRGLSSCAWLPWLKGNTDLPNSKRISLGPR